jgi:hypothetical protein
VLREKYPLKSEADISRQISRITKSQASMSMDEAVWKRVLQKMYDRRDFTHLYSQLSALITSKNQGKENDMGWASNKNVENGPKVQN